jgi:hypothetical protein
MPHQDDRPHPWMALTAALAVTVVLFLAAWILWLADDDKAHGAALTLVGASAGHLLKETGEVIKAWLPPTRRAVSVTDDPGEHHNTPEKADDEATGRVES